MVARPGRNAAREAKRLKEIRKVKNAIQWHERERKKRQELAQERWETKQSVIQRIKWENENVKAVRREALRNAKEDWQLGPLRPNRAVGGGAEKYGALTAEKIQKPDISVKIQKNRNEHRARRGIPLEYPLVVDDKKYFPIVKDDRVVILKGKDKGKIGVVQEVVAPTHEVMVKGLNMQYYDSDLFNSAHGGIGPKHASEVPIPLADVRLVIPSEITRGGGKRYSDVVVEDIFMERHTTGIDPYTGTDYGSATIPEDHQNDPLTGLPIFHRYIAGTQHRIEWPWEREEEVETSDIAEKSPEESKSFLKKTLSTLRHPITSLKSWREQKKAGTLEETKADNTATIEQLEQEAAEKLKERPRSIDPKLPRAYDMVDTTRNIVEGAESMSYTLVAPPFPDTLFEEIRSNVRDLSIEAKKDKEAPRSTKLRRTTEQSVFLREVAKEKKRAAESMKTPMQLRWELEHAKKLQKQKKEPLVETEALLMALGQHMQKNGVKVKRRRQATEDLD